MKLSLIPDALFVAKFLGMIKYLLIRKKVNTGAVYAAINIAIVSMMRLPERFGFHY
jgi:hypothetical protein